MNFLIPLAILPIYAALQNVRDEEIEAARDLGASAAGAFWRVTFPLAWGGVFAAFALTFIIAAGDYVTPQLVGGTSGGMIGRSIASTFGTAFNWPLGAALSFLTLAFVLAHPGRAARGQRADRAMKRTLVHRDLVADRGATSDLSLCAGRGRAPLFVQRRLHHRPALCRIQPAVVSGGIRRPAGRRGAARTASRSRSSSALFTAVVGTSAAFALSRRRSRWLDAFTAFVTAPLVLPALFLGIALLSFYTQIGLKPSLWTAADRPRPGDAALRGRHRQRPPDAARPLLRRGRA